MLSFLSAPGLMPLLRTPARCSAAAGGTQNEAQRSRWRLCRLTDAACPMRVQRSGFVLERRSSAMSELFPREKSEGYGACDDVVTPRTLRDGEIASPTPDGPGAALPPPSSSLRSGVMPPARGFGASLLRLACSQRAASLRFGTQTAGLRPRLVCIPHFAPSALLTTAPRFSDHAAGWAHGRVAFAATPDTNRFAWANLGLPPSLRSKLPYAPTLRASS